MSAKETENTELKARYLRKAIEDCEYSFAPEYDKTRMSSRAADSGTLDFDYDDPDRDVELCDAGTGAWVNARVWVPKDWLDSNGPGRTERNGTQ